MNTNIAILIEQSVNVIDSLNSELKLTQEEQRFFCDHFVREYIKKNQFTIQIGDYEEYIYFIESGILRYWTAQKHDDPVKEVTFWFSFSGEFVNSYSSFKENQPSLINIQALTDCVIWKMPKKDLADLYRTSLNINKIARIVLEDALCRKINRENLLLGSSAENIYKDLVTRNKELLQNIPLKYIASYIGITPQRLSQIRRMI